MSPTVEEGGEGEGGKDGEQSGSRVEGRENLMFFPFQNTFFQKRLKIN